MYNYDIMYNVEYKNFPLAFLKRNVWKIGTPFRAMALQVERLVRHLASCNSKRNIDAPYSKLARLFARWHVKMRS